MKLLLVITLLWLHSTVGQKWDNRNNPSVFSSSMNYAFSKISTSGSLKQTPWSDTYWPSFQSGIAHRWFSSSPQDFSYNLYTKEQLVAMATQDLKMLSPAEKYDIFVGRYDYPTVHSEWKRTSAGDAKWEGLCHGWAPASLFYAQPSPIAMKSSDGIVVPFGSSDIKALLTYFAAEYQERAKTSFLGSRCQYDLQANPSYENETSCADVNAGAFFVILGNQIGEMNEGFIIDRDRSIQVWNQPIASYQTVVLGSRQPSSPEAVTAMEVVTKLMYAKETAPAWEAHEPYMLAEKYQYVVELDSNGRVIGGIHETWDRPDFAWKMEMNEFSNYFAPLKTLYESSISGNPVYPRSRDRSAIPRSISVNHLELPRSDRCFGTPVTGYPSNHRASWTIRPSVADENKHLVITFKKFSTERFRDKVKIYEGATGEGALVAVLHGRDAPEDVRVATSSAYIVFTSDDVVNDVGFEACVSWV